MSEAQKKHLISAAITFVATFLVTLGLQMESASTVQFTSASVLALLFSAGRAGIKAAAEKWILSSDA